VLVRAEHSKTGRPRWVPCPPWLCQHLCAGVPRLSRQVVHNALKRACKDAGVAPFGPHMLRHRRATLWHQQGVVAVELAARLGHSKPSMSLDVYSHVPRLSEAPAHRLDALLR
jgi:integrase